MRIFHTHLILVMSLFAFSKTQAQIDEIPKVDWTELQKTLPWKATEYYAPVPSTVTPGYLTAPPSDAFVLFNGNDIDQWRKPYFSYGVNMEQISAMAALSYELDYPARDLATWEVKDGQLIVAPGEGSIETDKLFGDVQLHIEWLAPFDEGKEGQEYSNSGIFFMGLYEVQILNNYENSTYVNGQASSIYKQYPPMVNSSRPPGEWQVYDIIFNTPKFDEDGNMKTPAYITVLHNGVLTQNHVELEGPTCFIGKSSYTAHPDKLPLSLQDHGNKVRFRNIWIREL